MPYATIFTKKIQPEDETNTTNYKKPYTKHYQSKAQAPDSYRTLSNRQALRQYHKQLIWAEAPDLFYYPFMGSGDYSPSSPDNR